MFLALASMHIPSRLTKIQQFASGMIREVFSLDPRAISLMRIFVSILLLLDLFIRAQSLTAHYTSSGALPFAHGAELYLQPTCFTVFSWNDSLPFAALIFSLSACAFLFLLLGYQTRIATFVSWILLCSLQNRNPLVLQGGDDLLRLTLFWGVFLPWNAFYSVDAGKNKAVSSTHAVFSAASAGYLLLIFSLYFFSGILKSSAEWASEGTALYYALNLDMMTWPLGRKLLDAPLLLKCLSPTIRWLEIILPCMLFIPFKTSRVRHFVIAGLVLLNVFIGLTLFVGLFGLINIACLFGLLPSASMTRIHTRLIRNNKVKGPSFADPPARKNYYLSLLKNCLLVYFIALSLIWNINAIPGSPVVASTRIFPIGYALRLDQYWGMFAPNVLKEDGWFVYAGMSNFGMPIDLNRGGEQVSFKKPAKVLDLYQDDRWRKFLENYQMERNIVIRNHLCKYLITRWNRMHTKQPIRSLHIIFMRENTPAPGSAFKIKPDTLCSCLDN